MNRGIDSPAGRMDTIPSSLTPGLLRYFTPYPLTDLLDRSQELSIDDAQLSAVGATSLPFLISGALSFRDGRFDPRQSAILVDIALGNVRLESVQDLLAIGRALGVRSPEMRSEMVYADAPIASLASVIFAHHEAVPALMNELAVGINHAGVEVHPYLQAIVTGFYCVHVHPFLDGNGRWSRAVAAATGISSHALLESYVGALFMCACKDELARTGWGRARTNGLREYIERALRFRKLFIEEVAECLVGDTERVFSLISEFSKTRSCRNALLTSIYSKGEVGAESIRMACNVSRKVADGRISAMQMQAESYRGENSRASIRPPWKILLRASDHARRVAMADAN